MCVRIKASILETESRTEQGSFFFKVSFVFGRLWKYYFWDITHLTKHRESFSDYFPDLDIHTFNWVVDPFKCEIGNIPEEPPGLAEAILELRSNTEASIQFESKENLSSFWLSKAAKAFKIAYEKAVKKLLPFATTYLCEQGFSILMNIKTMNRNRLNAQDCIQIALTSKSPNFEVIVSNMKQHHFSKTWNTWIVVVGPIWEFYFVCLYINYILTIFT